MIRALFFKELREIGGWMIGIFAFQLSITLMLMDFNVLPLISIGQRQSIPFLEDDGVSLAYLGGILMLVIAFRQTSWESSHDYFLFLLHRPVARWTIFAAKLAVGAFAYAVCVALPLVILGLWAATPGTHASPFRWSMTSLTWCLTAGMMIPYFGAFLSGIRPGKWVGTRPLPLLGAIVCMAVCLGPLISGYPVASLSMILIAVVGYVASILHIATQRDY